MELRTVDPRKLKPNPNNPRRTKTDKFSDAQMEASIKAVGVLQPPLVREEGKNLVIQFGHRRVTACIKLGKTAMPVLVKSADEVDGTLDPMGTVSENVIRTEMGQVDRWRAMEALATAGWNDAAIGEALGMTSRNIAQARLLAKICPAMLDQMALNDLPDQRELRIIAAATKEEQAQVWKKFKPKRGYEAPWGEITHALSKTRLMAKNAKFSEDEAQAFGIVWEEDLFAPADEDSRSTTQIDAFLAAQTAWLETNLRKDQCIVEIDEYSRPKLPRGAQQYYGRSSEGVFTAFYIEPRSGLIREAAYTTPKASTPGNSAAEPEPVRKPRPDVTAKGDAMIGDYRTDALHQALRGNPIDDDQLIAMLVLALAGRNVTVLSGVAGQHHGTGLRQVADTLTDGGVLTRDLAAIRLAARKALVEVLSCRQNQSASGIGARYAGTAIDADSYLPNMATEEFLPALSRTALDRCASAHSVAPQVRVKDTRAALIARFSEGTFIYPGARFAPTEAELEAPRSPAGVIDDEVENEASGDDPLGSAASDPDCAFPERSAEADEDHDGTPPPDEVSGSDASLAAAANHSAA
jgi:ParB/RepB/Spo0J family partition protein